MSISAAGYRARLTGGYIGGSLLLAVGLLATTGGAALGQSEDNTKIVIGANNTGFAQIPISVAFSRGFFKKAGLDVTMQQLSGGTPAAMAAFSNNSVNIVNLSAPELIQYLGKGVVAGKGFGEVIDQSFDVVAKSSIKSMKDLKGKTIGISGPNSGDWIFFVALLQHYGIAASEVTFVTAGNPVNRLAALTAGSIDAGASSNNSRPQAEKAGTLILKSNDSPVAFPSNLVIASNDLLANHKPLLKKFVTAVGEANAWMKANPAEAAADCTKITGGTLEDCTMVLAFNFDRTVSNPYTWSLTMGINVEGIKSALEVMATIQPDTKRLKVEDVVDTSIAGTKP